MTAPRQSHGAYVAFRWPDGHVLYRLMLDGYDGDVYAEIRERVEASIREALDAMGVHVIETSEEVI